MGEGMLSIKKLVFSPPGHTEETHVQHSISKVIANTVLLQMKIPSTSDGMKTGYLLLTLIMVMLILLVATQRIFSHDYNRVNKNWPTPKEIQSGISSPNPNLGTTTSTGQG